LTNEESATPKVSVLMTCYNAASTIEESVRSVIAQTFSNWELVLVDNCSTDDSIAIIRQIGDARIRITQLERNHGRTPALNIGLNNARGEYLAILDADDLSTPDRLQLQVDCLDNNPNLVLVASWYRNINSGGKLINEVKTPTQHLDIIRRLALDNVIVNSSSMFRLASAKAVGGYEVEFSYSQDFALWLALSQTGKFAITPKFITDIRRTSDSLSSISTGSLSLASDCYALYRRAQGLEGLRMIDRLKGTRTIGLYGLLYAWRSLRAGNVVRAIGLTFTNFWAIPLAIIELLRKSLKSFKTVK
jgi:glycosyltransferase involved in cell wall biosynthesis